MTKIFRFSGYLVKNMKDRYEKKIVYPFCIKVLTY